MHHNSYLQRDYNLGQSETDDKHNFQGATLSIVSTQNPAELPLSFRSGSSVMSSTHIVSGKSAVVSGVDSLSPPPVSGQIVFADEQQQQPHTVSQAVVPATSTKPKIGSPRHFFSFRKGLFEDAVNDCVNICLRPSNDSDVKGSWLLTEISHWDHERERVFILTSQSLLIVKYDFIALRILHHTKLMLNTIDTIVRGNLTYPETSLVPARDDIGVRILWNKGRPLSAITSWNPFSSEIPWKTITDHPLYNYQDIYNSPSAIQEEINQNRAIYSVCNLYETLRTLHRDTPIETSYINSNCLFEETNIVLQNYVGFGAVIHNKNNLGFFKVRGNFSF